MTMAKVENGSVVTVGLPDELKSLSPRQLRAKGWHLVVGTEKPRTNTAPGYKWSYGAKWSVEDGGVVGVWNEVQRPQPYPSWSWVDGEGWVPPVAKPDGDFRWDESNQEWVEEDFG